MGHLQIRVDIARAERNSTIGSFPQPLIVFLSLVGVLYFGPITITGFYDPYLIPLIPMLMCLGVLALPAMETALRRWQAVAAGLLSIFYTLFTLGATHDYFSWNRARWGALRYLTGPEMQVSSRNIDGGYEFNGWYNYDPHYQASAEKSSWWVEDDDYVAVLGPIPGYQVVKRFPYEEWIPFGQGNILILRKTGSAS